MVRLSLEIDRHRPCVDCSKVTGDQSDVDVFLCHIAVAWHGECVFIMGPRVRRQFHTMIGLFGADVFQIRSVVACFTTEAFCSRTPVELAAAAKHLNLNW